MTIYLPWLSKTYTIPLQKCYNLNFTLLFYLIGRELMTVDNVSRGCSKRPLQN